MVPQSEGELVRYCRENHSITSNRDEGEQLVVDDQPHSRSAEEVLAAYDTSTEGLSSGEAKQRLAEHGENEVVQASERTSLAIFLAQFNSVLIWVLLAAAVLSAWADHTVDAVLIVVIVVVNGIFGFAQVYRAEQSLEALREMTAPTATVRRDGTTVEINSSTVYPASRAASMTPS